MALKKRLSLTRTPYKLKRQKKQSPLKEKEFTNNKNKLAKKIRNGLSDNIYRISIIIVVGVYEKPDELYKKVGKQEIFWGILWKAKLVLKITFI